MVFSYTTPVMMISVLTSFSFASLSWVLHDYPNHVYASDLSCVKNIDLMICEKQQNRLGSSDGSGGSSAAENEVDRSTSASNNENDEIPLIIPNISPTLDGDGGGRYDDGSSQENSEDGDGGANTGEANDRGSNANDNNNDDLEISAVPAVLPFP